MGAVPAGSGRRKATRLVSEARRRAGLGQTELARIAHVPLRTLTRIEANQAVPRTDTLERLLLACGRTLTTEARPLNLADPEDGTSVPNLIQALHYLRGGYVDHVLVGDLAARFHGAQVNVAGVDIVVPDSSEQRERLLRAVGKLDRRYSRVPVTADALPGDRFDRIWRAAAPMGPVGTLVAPLDDLIELEDHEARRRLLGALREDRDTDP